MSVSCIPFISNVSLFLWKHSIAPPLLNCADPRFLCVSGGLSVITDGIQPNLCRKSLCHPPLYCLRIPWDQFKIGANSPSGFTFEKFATIITTLGYAGVMERGPYEPLMRELWTGFTVTWVC